MIYLVFALVWDDILWLGIEVAGLAVYGFFCWLSHRFFVYWLALGWLLHPLWDVGLHLLGPGVHVVPDWYALACASFDVAVACYIFIRMKVNVTAAAS